MEPGRQEREEAFTGIARDRFDEYRRTIEDLPQSAWEAKPPWYVRVLQWLLLAGVSLAIGATWSVPGRWWWFGGIFAAAVVLGLLIQLLVPPSEGQRKMLAELEEAIDDLTELANVLKAEETRTEPRGPEQLDRSD
jgi:hypothetical protein